MTYSAPDLTLLGTAKTLVLGIESASHPLCRLNIWDVATASDYIVSW